MEPLLMITGLMIVFIGVVLLIMSLALELGGDRAKVSGGGVVIVGPVPIVFGTDRRAALIAAAVGAVLTVLAIVLFLGSARGWFW